MKITLPHALLIAAGLVVVREMVIPNLFNSSESIEIPDPKFLDSNAETIQLPSPKPKPEPQRREPEEIFHAAYRKPTFPLSIRTAPNKKQKLMERMKDHTVKIFMKNFLGMGFGTGWFLDHEIPVLPKKYPTKWFLATNAHVVSEYYFRADPYKQRPKIGSFFYNKQDLYLYKWESGGYDEEIFLKNKIDFEDPVFWSSQLAKKYHPSPVDKLPHSRDILTTKKHWHRKKETPSMHIKIEDPKLLYAAIDDNLKDHNGKIFDSFLDFAVLEIDFPDETSARRMTEQIYNGSENERINVMDKVDEYSQFYTVGYPGNSFNQFRPFGNYSVKRNSASSKSFCLLANIHKEDMQVWNGKKYRNNRCYYMLENFHSGQGASGSMVVDESGTLLGLFSRFNQENKYGFIQPIRGKTWECYLFRCIKQLEYDLIYGSRHQSTSYRQQLLKHLPQINTYLKNKYNWTAAA